MKDTDYSNVFFNEDLDKNSSELYYKGRQAKKQAKIAAEDTRTKEEEKANTGM